METNTKTKHAHPRGFAIVIVLVLVSIMMAFAAGASLLATENFRQVGRVLAATEAYYAAEGALEVGLLGMKKYGAGFTSEKPSETSKVEMEGTNEFGSQQALEDYCNLQKNTPPSPSDPVDPQIPTRPKQNPTGPTDPTQDPTDPFLKPPTGPTTDECAQYATETSNKVEAKWQLIGFSPRDLNHQVELEDDEYYYSTPVAATGNAGGSLCAPGVDIPLTTTELQSEGMAKFISDYNEKYESFSAFEDVQIPPDTPAADHPCHWNKLFVSSIGGGADKPSSVTIPLFVQFIDSDDNIIDSNDDRVLLNPTTGAILDNDGNFQGSFIEGGQKYSEGLGFGDESKIFVRFRTPCKPIQNEDGEWINVEMCSPDGRYELDTSVDSGDGNNTVVAWEIEELEPNPCGKLDSGGNCTDEDSEFYKIQHRVGPLESKDVFNFNDATTEIRESFINDATSTINAFKNNETYSYPSQIISQETGSISKYIMLVDPKNAPLGYFDVSLEPNENLSIKDFLSNIDYISLLFNNKRKVNDWSEWLLYKPVLRFTLLHDLKSTDTSLPSQNIPYLEYQVLSSDNFHPFSDAYQTVIAEGFSRGLKQTIRVKIPQERPVLQYAVQQ